MDDDIPDSIPGMTLLPIPIDVLLDTLERVSRSCDKKVNEDIDAGKVMVEFAEKLKVLYGNDWPSAAIWMTSVMLRALLQQYSIQLVIDRDG